ncbi:xanthine dehydrogenase family protein molybdopterin-binding subunit [Methylobacterium sp. WL30]|uniref:aldehyde oxidoreductase molybdenum-binding subunit PaoC n=2 Tax=Methylobacterium TaxID=407 RepID=UPI0011C9D4B1|nr:MULTISPECIES: aldehyde oxidoreductase molybdenum-binding subunit PaoC [unclassified Methylobacterium]MCJ2078466.1 xanthine dehydrogenase family protein molybdopterin-binding subunit [Methylobacterium sp. E-016]TXN25683.1 xanthine dehydrogenase family protein molybdopterin-binding subunit [Methylobacterium sp. WL93]TXN43531.1 xanthine dehydrogenase family protein molybdopterin-binding subunit [Methylobacterium sp. WL119]TXN61959.1 xanthine dehydrogenase family protein molybdopterin-binding su
MKFDQPAGQNPIDQLKVVGKPTDRVEGPLKVTGTAPYAYEWHDPHANLAYGFIVGAGIAKGRIATLDVARAKAASGVVAVVTHENAGPLGQGEFYVHRFLAALVVDHYHQAVAVVVAETFEQARAAAALVRVTYVEEPGAFDLAAQEATAPVAEQGPFGGKPETRVGDFEAAFARAPVQLDARYTTPDQAHAMMEPHATIAAWDGDRLTCHTSIQQMNWGVRDLARTLGIPRDRIRLVSPYVGGGFGGKGTVQSDLALAAVAARVAGRPVKLALQRAMMFNTTIHRPATIQRIWIGATRDGRITAIGHDNLNGNLAGGRTEPSTAATRAFYAGADRMTRQRLAVLDLAEGNAMRAPGEAPGLMALEIAMDEMAEKLGMDPVAFRALNDTQVDPEHPEIPFSTRPFVACLRLGAERFGWERRQAQPAGLRDGRWRVGFGMAGAIRAAKIARSAARVRLDARGVVTVEVDMTDIGTGSYTIVAQTAAEMMGVTPDRVVARLGNSDFPETPGSGGQQGAPSVTAGVYAACVKLREAVAQRLGFNSADVAFAEGEVRSGNRAVPLGRAAEAGDLVAEDTIVFGDLAKRFAQQTFGAHFAEVGVDADTGEIRVRRMLAVCAAGRIINPKAARSQIIGGMTMGIGAALMEEMVVDMKRGFFVNHDLAGYEVPVHADVPHLEAVFLDEVDPTMSPVKAKGVGELGHVGVAPAIANAVYNATGVRVRDYPITLDKLLDRMPDSA